MSTKHLSQLPQLFRGPFLRKVAHGRYYKELVERLERCGLTGLLTRPMSEIFESVYEILLNDYRCEYVYKNTLTQNWFLSRHSLENSYITDEFRIGENRVDLAVFGNRSIAFEIKTEFDSTRRLRLQSTEYIKVFDEVYIVTSEILKPTIARWIPKTVGIMELRRSGRLTLIRESQSHGARTDLDVVFRCLRRAEMVSIVETITQSPINVPNSKIFTECKEKFRKLLPFEAHDHVLAQLRRRSYPSSSIALMAEVPVALKHAALTLRATKRETESLQKALSEPPKPQHKEKTLDDEHLLSIPERQEGGIVCA